MADKVLSSTNVTDLFSGDPVYRNCSNALLGLVMSEWGRTLYLV